MSVLSTGITALNAFRAQLATTANNVANVNTEGYSRQITNLSTLPSTYTTPGYIGNGVQVSEIRRQFDGFLMDRVRLYTSSSEDNQVYLEKASRVDDVMADPDAGLSRALQDFFNSIQDVADDPTATSTRDVMLSSANILADRFHSVHEFLEGMRAEINQDMEILVQEANTLGTAYLVRGDREHVYHVEGKRNLAVRLHSIGMEVKLPAYKAGSFAKLVQLLKGV